MGPMGSEAQKTGRFSAGEELCLESLHVGDVCHGGLL